MSYARARRHYRAVQAQQSYDRGLFIPDRRKPQVITVLIIVALALFVKGLLLGLWAGGRD